MARSAGASARPAATPGSAVALPAAFANRGRVRALGEHLALDSAGSRIYWACARAGRSGLALRAWGSLEVPAGRSDASVLREIARLPWVRAARIEVAVRSPALKHRRLALPAMSAREAASVAQRRLDEFLREQSEECTGSAISAQVGTARLLWLVATPASTPEVFEARWRALGFEVHRLASEPLALGNLGRVLGPAPGGGLTALFDIQEDDGDCVICDSSGWLFNRVIPLHRQAAAAAEGAAADSEEADRLLRERMITELRRTFQYAEQELRLGTIQRLVLSGAHADLAELATPLADALGIPAILIGDAIERGPARGMDPAASRAIGLALAAGAHGSNLVPAAVLEGRRDRRARLALLGALGASAAAALLAALFGGTQLLQVKRDLSRLQAQMSAEGDDVSRVLEAEQSRARAQALEQALRPLRSAQPPLATWLEALRRLAPPDIALASLRAERGESGWTGTLTVEGRGDSVANAAAVVGHFGESMAGIPLFAVSRVERSPEDMQLPQAGAVRVQFRISGRLATLIAEQLIPAPAPPDPAPRPRGGRSVPAAPADAGEGTDG